MPTQLPGGGWDISDEEAAEIIRVSEERDAEVWRSRLVNRPWRTGRHNDRTIYVMSGPEASDGDLFIGTLDTPELVAEAVRAHNWRIAENSASADLVRGILEAVCERDGVPLESVATPGEPAPNYELALRLNIGQVFGLIDGSRS